MGGVTVATEVTENDVLQRGLQLCEDSCGGGVGEMPVAREDALLDRPWSPKVFLQESFIVIRFYEKRLDPAKRVENKPGCVAEIGEYSEARAIRRNSKPDRIRSVMRDGKSPDLEATNRKLRAGREEFPVGVSQAKILKCTGREQIAEDGQLVARQHHSQSACMVAMLVGEEDA